MRPRLGNGGPAPTQPDDALAPFEALEPRTLLSSFVYQDLGGLMGPQMPLYVLRPGGDHGPIRTIGSAVAAIGDIDRDGIADILVGAGGGGNGNGNGNGHGHELRAVAAVYSGRTGQQLFSFDDDFAEFGAALAGLGDVNGDGVPDFAVGSPRFDPNDQEGHGHGNGHGGDDDGLEHGQFGRVYVYSGANGALLYALTGADPDDRFGAAIAGAGDFNNDNVPDIVIGAPGADGTGDNRGRAYVYSGASGSLLARLEGLSDDDAFGYAVGGAGDVNNDGFDDVIVGAPGRFQGHQETPGHAYVFSGASHARLFTFSGESDGDWFGFSVDGVGDINNDGFDDVIVGAPSASNGSMHSAGVARIFSGANGQVFFTGRGEAPNVNLGAAVARAGDVDLDGHADFIIGAPAASPAGHVAVYSGASGRVLARFSHSTSHLLGGDKLGTSVAALGDVNGDGFTDFVFGATQDANPERNDRGRMYVFSGAGIAPLLPEGLNDDRDIWGSSGTEGFLILNGELFLLPGRPGFMSGDRVVDVNLGNTVLGGTDAVGNNGFIWVNGVRTPLASLITTLADPPGVYTGLRAIDITDSGLILVERIRDGSTRTAWILDHGSLRYLFDGVPVAMNEAQLVVGVDPNDPFRTIVWTSAGGAAQVAGVHATDVNEGGMLVGTTPTGMATWADGILIPVPTIAGGTEFFPRGISNIGEIVGTYHVPSGTSGFYFRPGEGISDIKPLVTSGQPDEFNTSNDLRLNDINNVGAVVGGIYDARRGFLLERMDGPGIFRGAFERRVEVTTTADGATTIVTINSAGGIIVFRRDPGPGDSRRIDLSDEADVGPANAVVIFIDPSGRTGFAATTAAGVILIEEDAAGRFHARNLSQEIPGSSPIVDSLFTLTPQDGLVLVGGRTASGDIVVYGMTTSVDDQGRRTWAFNNLSQTQLRDNGFEVPSMTEGLITYITPWNALNIAGLDTNGHVRVLWTAPGIQGWRENDLSAAAGTDTLVGGLTAYVAPWGGINVVGNDAMGHLVCTWWVPEFQGRWEKNDFTTQFGGPMLRAESMTSYVTPWGGLNVGGVADDGTLVVYWWVPGFNGNWSIDNINAQADGLRERPANHLTSHVASDGTFHLVGVGHFGDVLDMRWRPGQQWEVENLSA